MSETTGGGIRRGSGTGKVTVTRGEFSSRRDSEWTISFGYFRTPNGLPPGVEVEQDGPPIPVDPPRRRRRK